MGTWGCRLHTHGCRLVHRPARLRDAIQRRACGQCLCCGRGCTHDSMLTVALAAPQLATSDRLGHRASGMGCYTHLGGASQPLGPTWQHVLRPSACANTTRAGERRSFHAAPFPTQARRSYSSRLHTVRPTACTARPTRANHGPSVWLGAHSAAQRGTSLRCPLGCPPETCTLRAA